MGYGKPKKAPKAPSVGGDHESKKRHVGSAMAKKLGSGSHVSAHSSTHMKSRMKRY